MSLSISDARVFSAALKKARQKRKLTQAECAELLDHSVSFQKDLERGRCSQALRGFTISAGRSAFPRTTVSSRMEPTEPALHTRRCCGCSRCATKRACPLSWLLQLYLQVLIRMPC